jgi:putative acetyltransferase
MLLLQRTDAKHPDFHRLIRELDKGLLDNYQEAQSYYDQFNKLDDIKHVVLAYEGEQALGCGAIKHFDEHRMEVKRMYVAPEARGQRLATKILSELEDWAKHLGYSSCILETGTLQTAAIALYTKEGYAVIPNYGQYVGMDTSICFEKELLSVE